MATSTNCIRAAGRASAIIRWRLSAAPSIGTMPCVAATSSARISAK